MEVNINQKVNYHCLLYKPSITPLVNLCLKLHILVELLLYKAQESVRCENKRTKNKPCS